MNTPKRKTSILITAFFFLSLLLSVGASGQSGELDYNRDVRPILSDNCFRCHGPDADNQKSEFRLDTRERAIADLGGYAGIVPGDLDASEAHHRIWEDEVLEDRMPPPESKLSLSDEEKRILDRWIAEGAQYDQHWSFKPIARPQLPELSPADRAWASNEIDHFILDRLKEEGLDPSDRASKATLIRRVSLDLTGLPPTPEEVDAFLNDESEGAWERLVDRLIGSPRYGERMALVWLDAARYADSGGYQNDMRRSQWPWRDWVIDAYNANMPFDRFTIEQLAGDLLPNPTREQRLATAFNRNHRINNEGGIVPDEFIVEYVADRVETTSTVWLGLTMNCSRCHDHKYDPITQKDFYSLFAFFNNIDEHGQDGTIAPAPNMDVYTGGTEVEHRRLKDALDLAVRDVRELPKKRYQNFNDWLAKASFDRAESIEGLKSLPLPTSHLTFDSVEDGAIMDARDSNRKGILVGRTEKDPRIAADTEYGSGIRLTRTGYARLDQAHGKIFDSSEPRTWLTHIHAPRAFAGSEGPLLAMAEKDSLKGYRIMLEDTGPRKDFRVSFQLMLNLDKEQGIEVVTGPIVEPDKPVRIGVSWDGSHRASGVGIYVNGEAVETTVLLDNLESPTTSSLPLLIGARAEKDAREFLRDATLNNGIIDDVQIFDRALSDSEIAALSSADPVDSLLAHLSPSAQKALEIEWISQDGEGRGLLEELAAKERELNLFESQQITRVSVMEETPDLRPSYILKRGAYDQPDTSEVLEPRSLEALPPMKPSLPRNRLGLAKWIVDPENPLTARVAVNRYWQMYFGKGLVKTAEDFGSQGESPSHPELLDWMASEFIENGWDIRAMQKMIVMSSTYRQSSRVTDELLEKDPENRLIARGPRYRLNGQSIRDQALAVSGLLVERIGGPPVMPYQPEGLWDEVSAKGYKYIVGEDDDLYRRSMYTFWRRTVPPPSMMNFDNASREACSVLTARTNTPLQALNLMNDEQFVEAARSLAERMLRDGGSSPDEQIAYGHKLALSRNPDPDVLNLLTDGYRNYLDTYESNPDQAKKLIEVGASSPSHEIESTKLAAMSVVANVLLNLDETLTKE
ncbi:MAG: hypothetical protein CMI15_05285 [Opitutaceae bacterium]|nr:hypothetical protein [Opitutaceae bacterium]